jgi:hypothetical protein
MTRWLVLALLLGCGARSSFELSDAAAQGGGGGAGGGGPGPGQGGFGASCAMAIGGPDGYDYANAQRLLSQPFTLDTSGRVRRIEVDMQVLNGGEDLPLRLKLVYGSPGVPQGFDMAVQDVVPPLPYGWSTYSLEVEKEVHLDKGQLYSLQLESSAGTTSQHTVVHCTEPSCTVSGLVRGDMWVKEGGGPWHGDPSGGAMTLRVVLDDCAM